jgi:hypothetical protein
LVQPNKAINFLLQRISRLATASVVGVAIPSGIVSAVLGIVGVEAFWRYLSWGSG